MLGIEIYDGPQVGIEGGIGFIGETIHQVDREVVKAGVAGRADRDSHLFGVVQTTQSREISRIEGLCSE